MRWTSSILHMLKRINASLLSLLLPVICQMLPTCLAVSVLIHSNFILSPPCHNLFAAKPSLPQTFNFWEIPFRLEILENKSLFLLKEWESAIVFPQLFSILREELGKNKEQTYSCLCMSALRKEKSRLLIQFTNFVFRQSIRWTLFIFYKNKHKIIMLVLLIWSKNTGYWRGKPSSLSIPMYFKNFAPFSIGIVDPQRSEMLAADEANANLTSPPSPPDPSQERHLPKFIPLDEDNWVASNKFRRLPPGKGILLIVLSFAIY